MTTAQQHTGNGASGVEQYDAVVVGAGFAGMYMVYKMREAGLTIRVFEAGTDVGGTWYWNRYPGARCDVESLDYQYSFSDELQREWNWTERYATQPEILEYAKFVADKFDLRRDMQFETRVTSAHYDEATKRWNVETDKGERVTGRFFVAATGCLSAARIPDYPGLDSFNGDWYHTGFWPQEGVDFTGKRVGIIGTGSSGIQSIPVIARQAQQLTVFQRTPNYSVPAQNDRLTPERVREFKDQFLEIRQQAKTSNFGAAFMEDMKSALEVSPEERQRAYEERWEEGGPGFLAAYVDLITNKEANDTAAEFVRQKIRETVKDPEVAAKLMPRDHPLGTKRICVDIDYFDTYNRDNVSLVDVRATPIQEITPKGIRTSDAEYELDAIVFATGFDAMTGALLNMDIRGRGGKKLADAWAEGPKAYLGLSVAGFPNMFTITGPGSPSVLSNMIISIEQHVEWITDCIDYMRHRGFETIEATTSAQEAWVEHVREAADRTLFPQANSWYVGANIPGKPRVFMPYIGGVGAYREKCDEVATHGYDGFVLEGAKVAAG